MSRISRGTVYLVGAGPGDPELITVRGLSLLRQADVVAHDRLVHPALLAEAPPLAERLYVGKAPDRHAYPQEAINALLVARAREGRAVVRLKGGDPFVFGRGGEEGQALAAAGIPFEVVPGVTSAVAAPACAGIPVTHRGVAAAFTVVTGHGCEPDEAEHDWQALARAGTLVILMGLGRLAQISQRLLAHGCAPETPAAVIRSGSTGAQEVVEGTLATIAGQAAGLGSPATIVVGEVVRLRSTLAWFHPAGAPEAEPLLRPLPAYARSA
jgi:uroporphyrin-III C-methyltransferase